MASVSKELLTPAGNPDQLCCDGVCSSDQVCNYDWTEGLDWLFSMAPPLDNVPSTMVNDHLQVQSSDIYWDNEEWANQVKSAKDFPMVSAPYDNDAPIDGQDNECPLVLPTWSSSLPSTFESPRADSVSVLPPSPNSGLPFSDKHSVSIQKATDDMTDINGNCIAVSGTVHSPASKPGPSLVMNPEFVSVRLVPEVKPPAPPTHEENVPVTDTPRYFRTVRVPTRFNVNFVHQAKQCHSRPLRLQFPNLESALEDFLASLIRNAKFGGGEVQRVAQKELESLTMSAIHKQLLEKVPGLADRGISHTSIQRLLQPLTIRKIRKCLKDSSAWCAVNEVIVI